MTKVLKTLIKLHKSKLDKILKDIEFNEAAKLKLIEKKISAEQEMNQEIEQYSATEFSFVLEKYIENSRKLLKQLELTINQKDAAIARLKGQLKDQYSELKKYEIALINRQTIEYNIMKKQEAKQIDEFNINNFASRK